MAAIRANILTGKAARQGYVNGLLALKAESTGVMSDVAGIPELVVEPTKQVRRLS